MTEYVVVNEDDRIRFEKKHQISYGYGKCLFFSEFYLALSYYSTLEKEKDFHIIEEIKNGSTRIVFPEDMKDRFVEV